MSRLNRGSSVKFLMGKAKITNWLVLARLYSASRSSTNFGEAISFCTIDFTAFSMSESVKLQPEPRIGRLVFDLQPAGITQENAMATSSSRETVLFWCTSILGYEVL